jgi:hypothetical protein
MNDKTNSFLRGATTSASSSHFAVSGVSTPTLNAQSISGAHSDGPSLKELENAVYGYIRALRALGRTEVTSTEIAQALGISTTAVQQVLSSLQKKGVKVAA